MERVAFKEVSLVRQAAEREFRRCSSIIKRLIPKAAVEHVGSTALPSGLTKGDLDIQVRVAPGDFGAARSKLESAFPLDPENVWGEGAASFKIEDAELPIGIHLTVIDGEFDTQWKYRETLAGRPDLVEEYDDLKRRFDGKSMTAYRKAKGEFFSGLRKLKEYPKG
jgi:GrpB-like predicted nucleotidyltransferase (UPF0157 family)